jgi:hypothetical protein
MDKPEQPKLDTNKSFDEQLSQHSKIASLRWKNRRRMAWLSLFAILFVTFLCLFVIPIARIKELDSIITFFYLTMSGIVMGYLGFATLDDKWKK